MTPCAYDFSCWWDVKYKQANTNDNNHHMKHGTNWQDTYKLEASIMLVNKTFFSKCLIIEPHHTKQGTT